MKMKKKELWTFTEALLFIIGAVFLSFNIVSGAGVWFFIGLALALIAFIMWICSFIVEKRAQTASVKTTKPTAK
jgi:hypothetical protein